MHTGTAPDPGRAEALSEWTMPDAPPLYDPPGQSAWVGVDWRSDEPPALRKSPQAQQALLLGIASLGVLGLILGPIAIYLGYRAKREIEEGISLGDGEATVGMVLGMAGFVVMTSWFVSLLVPAIDV